MQYTKLGNTDIEISKLCIGCMSFGKAGTMHDWTLDAEKSEAVIKLAPNATMGKGLSIHYSGGSTLDSDVEAWLKLNNIK